MGYLKQPPWSSAMQLRRVPPSQRYAFKAGRFEVQDGNRRCLGVASCDDENGSLVLLAPLRAPPPLPHKGGFQWGAWGGGGETAPSDNKTGQ